MNLKNLLIPALLALGLAACNEETTNYQGSYKADSGLSLTIERVDNSQEYKFTTEIYEGKKFSVAAKVKNKTQLYDSKDNLLGEFEGNNFKNTKGVIFSKMN